MTINLINQDLNKKKSILLNKELSFFECNWNHLIEKGYVINNIDDYMDYLTLIESNFTNHSILKVQESRDYYYTIFFGFKSKVNEEYIVCMQLFTTKKVYEHTFKFKNEEIFNNIYRSTY